MVPAEAVSEWIEQTLDRADKWIRATDVLGEKDPAPGTEHSLRLADRGSVIRDRAEAVGAYDCVEGVVGKIESLGVANLDLNLTPEVSGPPPAELGHLRAELHAR